MTDAAKLLQECSTVVVVDWPSREVPEALVDAGLTVIVKGGPGPGDFSTWHITNGQVTTQHLGRPPEHADLVYFHRPFSEMPSIIRLAQDVGAQALWRQSGLTPDGPKSPRGCWVAAEESRQGRDLAAAAGLEYVDNVYIADALRASQSWQGLPGLVRGPRQPAMISPPSPPSG
jgi:predicted CoA-binding protein